MKFLLVALVLPSVIFAKNLVDKAKGFVGAATGKTDKETRLTLSEYYNEKEKVLQRKPDLYSAFKGAEELCNEKCIEKGKKFAFAKTKYEKCSADCKLKKAYELGDGKVPTKGPKKPDNKKKQKESMDNEITSRS